jgi:glyoxylase-like metal-dependent hydrolase (beta-lactamase superfamily II)
LKVKVIKGFANTYIVEDRGEILVIDPGNPPPKGISSVVAIVLTHGHFDHYMHAEDWIRLAGKGVLMHIGDQLMMEEAPNWVMKYFGIPVPPPPKVEGYLQEGDTVVVGSFTFQVWEVPGHSPGSIALLGNGVIFTGDLLFEMGGVGRTDLPEGDERALFRSINRVLSLPESTLIYPGHGEPFTVSEAKRWFRV